MQNAIKKISGMSGKHRLEERVSKLSLGTAQLGMPYGVANRAGNLTPKAARSIILAALEHGVRLFDTARAYGNSEEILGTVLGDKWRNCTKVVTKLSPLSDCAANASKEFVRSKVTASVDQSLKCLRREKLDVILLHRAVHFRQWEGVAWETLKELKAAGFIGELGVSIQSPEELDVAMVQPGVDHVQLPFNILDWRWGSRIEKLRTMRRERKFVVHGRSALLQGLLTLGDEATWHRANVTHPSEIQRWLRNTASAHGFAGLAELCIAFVRSQDWIDHVVLGMETREQVDMNASLFALPPLNDQVLQDIMSGMPLLTEATLEPSRWKLQFQEQ